MYTVKVKGGEGAVVRKSTKPRKTLIFRCMDTGKLSVTHEYT